MQTLIELRNVSKSFPGVKALQGVHFTVFPGEIVSLCGANGAGKSTMSNIIAGVYPHDSGEIIIDNEVVSFASPKVAESLGIGIVHHQVAELVSAVPAGPVRPALVLPEHDHRTIGERHGKGIDGV